MSSRRSSLRRIGTPPYLNTLPLIEDLRRRRDVETTLVVPSRLSRLMARGAFDAALLPSAEFLRDGLYRSVAHTGIICDGDALSVRLYFRVPPAEIRTAALDANSRTSNVLARIILEKRLLCRPRYRCSSDPLRESAIDAAVVIGDNAFRTMSLPYLDLGREWKEWTGLPFVFALWAARRDDRRDWGFLDRAATSGRKKIPAIARRAARRMGLPEKLCRDYLTDNIRYRLGEREQRGLRLFARHAKSMGLL